MGFLKGSCSLRRYRALSTLSGAWRESVEKAISAHALLPLDPERGEDKAIGWANALDEQDLDLSFGKFFVDGRIVLALRIDTLKPPPAEVKRLLRIRQREIEAARKEPLSAGALRELKAMIAADLRRRTPPKTRTATMIWDLDSRRVLLDSHSKGINEAFLRLFAQTFNIALDIEGPGSLAVSLADASALAKVKPDARMLGGFADLRPCLGSAVDAETLAESRDTEDDEPSPEALDLQDRRFLGREFLTWLIYAASADNDGLSVGPTEHCGAFQVRIGERIGMRALGQGVGEFTARGVAPAETADVRYCLAGGHTVRACEVYFQRGERVTAAMILADGFDLSRVRLPALLTRLDLIDEVEAMLRAAYGKFLRIRLHSWADTIGAIGEWLRRSLEQ